MEKITYGTKKLAFGLMRLPMLNETDIDYEQTSKMVDLFLENGFQYFDTARPYHNGKSEGAVKQCLTSRYPREKYFLTDKLTSSCFEKEEEILPLFQSQLDECGVEYFDNYLLHAMTLERYQRYESMHVFEKVKKLKEEGKIRHIGMSFHDKAEVLETILQAHPEIEVVQLQFNYLDFNDVGIQSKANYDVCMKYEKSVLVMEPVKGGKLAQLPTKAHTMLENFKNGSDASYAIRFAASFDGVSMVLSGMSNLEQMQDNIATMKDFVPLNETEEKCLEEIRMILIQENAIACTGCRYCVEGCPQQILIPNLFSCYNDNQKDPKHENGKFYYNVNTSDGHAKASECLQCGQCEGACPQHLPIIELLQKVAKTFETK